MSNEFDMKEVQKAVTEALAVADYNKAARICSTTWNKMTAQGLNPPDLLTDLSHRIVKVRLHMSTINIDLKKLA